MEVGTPQGRHSILPLIEQRGDDATGMFNFFVSRFWGLFRALAPLGLLYSVSFSLSLFFFFHFFLLLTAALPFLKPLFGLAHGYSAVTFVPFPYLCDGSAACSLPEPNRGKFKKEEKLR
jgi:hypothetical protein